jgi:hypothetical protein
VRVNITIPASPMASPRIRNGSAMAADEVCISKYNACALESCISI